jgi:DNA-binding NtrC family response regulator
VVRRKDPDSVSTVARPAERETTSVTTYVVAVVQGPDRGLRLELDGANPSRIFVGQSPACELRLTDPEVSRRHAAFDASERPLRLTDLGSKNGTFVNGVKVLDAHLRGGETIALGQTTLAIEVAQQAKSIPVSDATSFGRMRGGSLEMRRLYPLCERLALTEVPVVIEGETGTGKEVLAQAIHEVGPRRNGPFVVFDCTSVPMNLVEAELFGHERGAFTGAVGTRKGLFEQAHGGTLLIDEIGDLELGLQPKLLRAIQRGETRRVGGNAFIPSDVRILAATRRDLDREVQEGRFRDDLFFRLAIARLELPPLRRRHGDVALLARAFWEDASGEGELPYDLLCRWEAYSWPGNVRELRNEVVRRAALGELAEVERSLRERSDPSDDPIADTLARDLPFARAKERVIAEFERRYVERIVKKHGGNVSRAAAASGIAHRYFQILRARHAK